MDPQSDATDMASSPGEKRARDVGLCLRGSHISGVGFIEFGHGVPKNHAENGTLKK